MCRMPRNRLGLAACKASRTGPTFPANLRSALPIMAAAALLGPTLTGEYGFSLMQAHLFLLYYAVLSAMTPPVAVAAYAAAGIAGANPIAIAATAWAPPMR